MIDKFDLTLGELSEIAQTDTKRDEKQVENGNLFYKNSAQCLKENLVEAAMKKETEYTVFKSDTYRWRFPELKTNIYCGWRDGIITPEMVVDNAEVIFKIIYEYCEAKGLKPKIDFWDDGCGESSEFRIKIKW